MSKKIPKGPKATKTGNTKPKKTKATKVKPKK